MAEQVAPEAVSEANDDADSEPGDDADSEPGDDADSEPGDDADSEPGDDDLPATIIKKLVSDLPAAVVKELYAVFERHYAAYKDRVYDEFEVETLDDPQPLNLMSTAIKTEIKINNDCQAQPSMKTQTLIAHDWTETVPIPALNPDCYELRGSQLPAFEALKDEQFAILNAPTGWGKSIVLIALIAYKLLSNPQLRCIITVPQTIIGRNFTRLLQVVVPGFEGTLKWDVQDNLCLRRQRTPSRP